VGTSGSGHAIAVDTKVESGGFNQAPSPTELVMIALCGCTAMDVVSILKKKRIEITDLEVSAESELAPDLPKRFARIELVYRVWGANVPEEALQRSIELSKDKYCTVSNTLSGKAEITYRYEINPPRS
jgi:putative redox protein